MRGYQEPRRAENYEDRVYLKVPFAEKDAAKKRGARWDPIVRCWYTDIYGKGLFTQWLPDG